MIGLGSSRVLAIISTEFRISQDKIAVILVDHGSKRSASNDLLLEVAKRLHQRSQWLIVEPAHMELAEPSIATAFKRCVERGAKLVVVFPYFLSPGRHWHNDIPRLAGKAAASHPGIRYLVTAPLGLHELILQVIDERIDGCLARVMGRGETCDQCDESSGCKLLPANSPPE